MTSSLASVLTYARIQLATTVFCALIIAGLFTSSFFRVLPSIGIIGLTITAIVYAIAHRRIAHQANWPVYASLAVVFLLHLASGFNTNKIHLREYERDIILQLPFLVLPLAFWLLPSLHARNLRRLWLLFFGLVVISALRSTINYWLHTEEINQAYLRSQVMPTEPDHIRFSLMISLAIVVGIMMSIHKMANSRRHEWVVGSTLFLILYQHVLAVRSGLVSFYALGIVAIIWLIWKAGRYKLATLLILALLSLPVLSFICFPTFRNKFHNTREDMRQVDKTHSANNYSLTGRVYSYRVAMMIVAEHPWLGVGNADMEQELAEKYKVFYPSIQPVSYIKPHNQFLYYLVAFGVLGVVLFTACFYYAAIWAWPRHAPLLVAQYCILTVSFLVEYTLETQIGLTFSLIFLLLALSGLMNKTEEQASEWCPS